jgi:phenylalanyl-tRNA synthetase beta chain
MRVSTNWLKEFLDVKNELDIKQVSHGLTMAGLEVEHHLDIAKLTKDLVWAAVLPSLTEVKYGEETRVIKNPSPKLSADALVAVREDGAKAVQLITWGDLGFETSTQDLVMFAATKCPAEPGSRVSDLPEFNDHILSLGITPNRADALSHLGVAREVSAFLDVNVRTPLSSLKEMAGPTHEKIVVTNEATDLCPRYAARVIENVKIGPSPQWLVIRLLAAGIRPINNVVDITNYVMLSRGQPLHAFDFAQVDKDHGRAKIIIRKAAPLETLNLLDGSKVNLHADDLVICDPKGPLALAGIMGGALSQVSNGTSTILLEAAYFAPKGIRVTARRHGLSTPSSFRFERGVDPNGVLEGLNYAARLISELACGQVCREAYDGYRVQILPKEIGMRLARAQSILGVPDKDFDQDFLRARFLKLGIETVTKQGETIYFRVPTFRPDLEREIDLIEEAARMFGLDSIKATTTVHSEQTQFADPQTEEAIKKISGTLFGYGFHEAVNLAFLPKDFVAHFVNPEAMKQVVELKNPLSERYAVMRPSLLPGLLKNLVHNANNQEKSVRLFEVGTVFLGRNPQGSIPQPARLSGLLQQDSFCIEEQRIAGVIAGTSPWYAFDFSPRAMDFFDIKGVIESIMAGLLCGLTMPAGTLEFEHDGSLPYLHPGASARVRFKDEQGRKFTLATFGQLHPKLAELIDVPMTVLMFEFNLGDLPLAITKKPGFIPFSRLPIIERDLSLLVNETIPVGDLVNLAHEVNSQHKILNRVKIFDIFRGKNIAAGKKSVSLTFSLQTLEKTLTDVEADQFVSDYLARAKERSGAELR